jgi:hypothetical protein
MAAFGGAAPRMTIVPWQLIGGPVVGVGAAVCAAVAAHLALRAADPARALARALVFASIVATVGSVAPFGGDATWGDAMYWVHLGAGNAFSQTLPLAAGACLVFMPLVMLVFRRRRRPSHDGPIRALRDSGAWLAATSLVVLPLLRRPPFAAGIAVGVGMVLVALAWLALRARFIARLRAGAQGQVNASPTTSSGSSPLSSSPSSLSSSSSSPPPLSRDGAGPYLAEGVLPYRLGGPDAAYELLVWCPPPSGAAAYRDTGQPVAMALVPVPDQRRKTAF